MLLLYFALMVCGLIVFSAGRIILGWILPIATMRRVDVAVSGFFSLIFKLCIVALAAIILYAVWISRPHSP